MSKLKWRLAGFGEIRRSAGVRRDLDARTAAIARAAGPGYVGGVYAGRTRLRGSVITATGEARADNARNNSLVKAVDAGR